MKTKVTAVDEETLHFEDGTLLFSSHNSDCCESHYLSFKDLELSNFDGLEFDLSKDDFFERVEGFGIKLVPLNGHPIPVPGYGYNNGYYGTNLDLVITNGKETRSIDITECQDISD